MIDRNVYSYQFSLAITKTREWIPWLKAICLHHRLYVYSLPLVLYVLHRKQQSYCLVFFSHLVAWTYMRQYLFGRNQQMNRSVKGQWKWWFVLLSDVYFVPDKFFQSMIDVKSKGISWAHTIFHDCANKLSTSFWWFPSRIPDLHIQKKQTNTMKLFNG